MPVTGGNQSSVTVQIPVPTPVQQRPKTPVSFGTVTPRVRTEPLGADELPPHAPGNLTSVILPWNPQQSKGAVGPTQLKRVRYEVVRYSHEAFLSVLWKKPKDFATRGAYADWLEENEPQSVGPKTLALMRDPNQNVWVHRTPEGKVIAGKHWTMPEIKAANKAAGGKWFDRSNNRLFGTRLLPRHVYSGPGGVYFVHEGDNFDRTQRQYRIAMFQPRSGDTGSWSTYHRDAATGREFAPIDAHDDVTEAVALARELAAGNSERYPKNAHWDEAQQGSSVE